MIFDLVISNGKIVSPRKTREGDDIAVEKGKIAAIGPRGSFPRAKEKLDATGKYILPGVIDAHVHFREPGYEYKEDFKTGTLAAAAGGVTMVLDMPNNLPFCCTVEAFEKKLALVSPKAHVDFGLVAAVTAESLGEIPGLARAGVNVYKIFMGATVGGVPAPDDGGMLSAFHRVEETGLRIGVHAENTHIVDYFTGKLKAEGRTDPGAHAASRPGVAEAEAIQRAILFARTAGCRLHIYHLSTREGVRMVRAAKAEGQDVSAETGPHYLIFDDSQMRQMGGILKINPPIRSRDDGAALWEGLLDGTIEVIDTDHSPHSPQEKLQDDIWKVIPGFAGVETQVPLMLTLVNEGKLSLNTYVKLVAENPARLFNLYPRKGTIQVGADADFTIVDLDRQGIIDQDRLHSKNVVTPFDGRQVKGMPVCTIVRGNIVMKNGEIAGKPMGLHIKPLRS
ncbi:MAG: allantoinase AllB [Desulfobacterales bacterium]|nr:allantoinase AllB [Desulfobacterales bacterium]